MEVSLLQSMAQSMDLGISNTAVRPAQFNDHIGQNGRNLTRSESAHVLTTLEDSPPRSDDLQRFGGRQHTQNARSEVALLSLEETTEIFRAKVEDARRDTQQLAGSEEVSEVVKPKLTLDLGHSNIARLPESVVDLIKAEVERLSLSHNQIWHIPLRFSECTHLHYLNVRSNVFREIPRGVYQLPALEILDISRNKIRKIPKDISNLKSLRVFSIMHNRVDDLPSEMCEMTKLQILKVGGNPLRGKVKEVVEAKESELALSNALDNEREQMLTAEIKQYLRELHPVATPIEPEMTPVLDESPHETPKPLKRVLSSRFPVVPMGSTADGTSDTNRSSPNQTGIAPPIPTRSHYRVISGPLGGQRRLSAQLSLSASERNRSNSEAASTQLGVNTRMKRMGLLRKEKTDLDAIDETKAFRQSHLRGFSHGSALRRNGSISSPLVGHASPSSPRINGGTVTPTAFKRLSSLPEGRDDANQSNVIVEGARGLLYSLYQIESQIRGLITVLEANNAKRSSLEFTFYNASKWLKRLNKALENAINTNPEDVELMEKAQDAVQQNCADCVMTYKQVILQLQANVKKIVAGTDPRYIRTFMLLLYGSVFEIKNAMKSFGMETRGHRRQMSSGNTHYIETIPEEASAPQETIRAATPNRGRSGARAPGSRLRSETTIQHPLPDPLPLQPVQPPQPPASARLPPSVNLTGSTLNGFPPNSASSFTHGSMGSAGLRSRSNSRTNFTGGSNSAYSSVANTPRSGEVFNLPPPSGVSSRINPTTGMTEAQEEAHFEQVFVALTRSYEAALQAIPLARKQFQRCLERATENLQGKDVRHLWSTLVHRCKTCQELSEALQIRLSNMPHKDTGYGTNTNGGGRNDPSFWLLCKTFLQSFVDLVQEMREAKELRLLPAEILVVLRPVQRASRDVGRLIEDSPWRHLADGSGSAPAAPPYSTHGGHHMNGYQNSVNGAMPAYAMGVPQNLHNGLYAPQPSPAPSSNGPTPTSFASTTTLTQQGMMNGMGAGLTGPSPTVHFPATPLSAALGPAAQATIPSTPASVYGDHFFKGDVFQRADSLMNMQQAGTINFLNRR